MRLHQRENCHVVHTSWAPEPAGRLLPATLWPNTVGWRSNPITAAPAAFKKGRLFLRWGVLAGFSIRLCTIIKHKHASAVSWKPSMQPQLVLENGGGFFCPCWFHFPQNSNTPLSLETPFSCFLSCCACFVLVNRHKRRSFDHFLLNKAWTVIAIRPLDGRNVGWIRETISVLLNKLFREWGGSSCILKRKILFFPLPNSVPLHCTVMLLLTNFSVWR